MRIIFVILALGLLSACARPTGDFGRARPDYVHDTLMPEAGKLRARMFEEPVSDLNWTDEEVLMHDLAWRFLVSPSAEDWFYDVLVQWQRTRIAPLRDTDRAYDRYYAFLRSEKFASSRIRYARVTDDVKADTSTMPRVFEAICAVEQVDRRRGIATDTLPVATQGVTAEVEARRQENNAYIDWFVRAAVYRYNSYLFALEALLIETPDASAGKLDAAMQDLSRLVDRAERHDFCSDDMNRYGQSNDDVIPSRLKAEPFSPGPEYRK